MRLHDHFGWNPDKAERNHRKHNGVTFHDAEAVLGDESGDRFHVEEYDDAHSTAEDRYITTGSLPASRRIVLRICWTRRLRSERPITWIISARLASPRERKRYAKEIPGL